LPSGGFAKTGAPAKTLTRAPRAGGKYAIAAKKIKGMSTVEFRQTLVRLGINKPDGKLTAKYTTKK
jgi:hypothetical protein